MKVSGINSHLLDRELRLRVFRTLTPETRLQTVGKSKTLDLASRLPAPKINLSRGANQASLRRNPATVGHLIQTSNPTGFQMLSALSLRF